MFRWNEVEEKTIFDMTVKMYREPFIALTTTNAIFFDLELDHYAYKYFESELFMYRILDVNFEKYMEERGDITRFDVVIPIQQDTKRNYL